MIIEEVGALVVNPEMPVPDKAPVPLQREPSFSQNIFNRLDFSDAATGFHSGPQKRSGLKLALWTWLSASIDTLVLFSMSCFFMVAFSFLMQSPARKVIEIFVQQPHFGKIFTGIFLVSFWSYLIVMRLFMGASIGEWTCQLRLGQPTQRLKVSYILKVIARTTLVLMTGVILFPILSLLFKRDLVGDITGIKIYSLK